MESLIYSKKEGGKRGLSRENGKFPRRCARGRLRDTCLRCVSHARCGVLAGPWRAVALPRKAVNFAPSRHRPRQVSRSRRSKRSAAVYPADSQWARGQVSSLLSKDGEAEPVTLEGALDRCSTERVAGLTARRAAAALGFKDIHSSGSFWVDPVSGTSTLRTSGPRPSGGSLTLPSKPTMQGPIAAGGCAAHVRSVRISSCARSLGAASGRTSTPS